jgi:hypothetical protein
MDQGLQTDTDAYAWCVIYTYPFACSLSVLRLTHLASEILLPKYQFQVSVENTQAPWENALVQVWDNCKISLEYLIVPKSRWEYVKRTRSKVEEL